ncbi:MAG: HAMP domain-containing sensor histidine kinase, partial [Pseudomonadota bacterium]
RRLAAAADIVRTGQGRSLTLPDFTGRRDEIGDLSGALRDMTSSMWARMDAIERFAADVAHEIKNPLTSLRSAVETLSRVQDPEKRNRLLAIIQQDVDRLDRLISDISDASRLDAELSRATGERVDVGEMLTMLEGLYRSTLDPDQARLVFSADGRRALSVRGLEGRLVQVLRNLISNAISFSPPGGRISVHAEQRGQLMAITVADEGPGLPPGAETRIFERFYSERPTGEPFGRHSGLGLSISKQIIEAHGGTIEAANRSDRTGAIFTILIPAIRSQGKSAD